MDLLPMEKKDLIVKNNENVPKFEKNGQVLNGETPGQPPDGGLRAYTIIVGSFLTNGLIFGVINSYGVIYTVLEKRLADENVPNSESKAAYELLAKLMLNIRKATKSIKPKKQKV